MLSVFLDPAGLLEWKLVNLSLLKGFTHTEASPGDRNNARITHSRLDLSIWDVVQQGWRKPQGQIGIAVGASSRDVRLQGHLPI